MLRRILKYTAVLLIVLIPLLLRWVYLQYTALPAQITIATGPAGGEWAQLSQSLREHVQASTSMRVVPIQEHTNGALHHLELLSEKQVDFALYMRGAQRMQPSVSLPGEPAFVCNFYSDITLLLIRRDLHDSERVRVLSDLRQREDGQPAWRVAVGRPQTGEYRLATAVMSYYFGDAWRQNADLQAVHWDYDQIEYGFAEGKLDVALITAGHQAPIFRRLLEDDPGLCQLGAIPEIDAIVMRNVALEKAAVPRGLFRHGAELLPAEPMETVAMHTSLLTHEDVPSRVVEEVLRIVTGDEFVLKNELLELSREGLDAARRNPEFPVHPGALHVYEPEMKPLVDPDIIESTENLRSFAVSLLIAGFLGYRWWHKRQERQKDHRLDEYIARLLEIDRAQPTVAEGADVGKLQKTLDRVISLRNKALREFSAKDFDEDSAADSFLNLCDTVASGINSRILQQQFQQGFREVVEALRESKK